jgi:ubiquinone/menaquinone biosynthesis C-methylase UbiE
MEKEIRKSKNELEQKVDALNKALALRKAAVIIDAIMKYEPSIVLDVGIGGGEYWKYVNEIVPTNKKPYTIGLDIDEETLRRTKMDNKVDDYVLGDAPHLPFRDSSLVLTVQFGIGLLRKKLDYTINEICRTVNKAFVADFCELYNVRIECKECGFSRSGNPVELLIYFRDLEADKTEKLYRCRWCKTTFDQDSFRITQQRKMLERLREKGFRPIEIEVEQTSPTLRNPFLVKLYRLGVFNRLRGIFEKG